MIYSLEEFIDFINETQKGDTSFDFIKFKEMIKERQINNK